MADLLKLTFLTNSDSTAVVRVPYPNRNLLDADVAEYMQQLIVTNIMRFGGARIISAVDAQLQTETEIPYSI